MHPTGAHRTGSLPAEIERRGDRAGRVPRGPVGPLAPTFLPECSRWFAAKGYSPDSAAAAVSLAQRLSAWMVEVRIGIEGIDEDLLDRFLDVERSRERPCSSATRVIAAHSEPWSSATSATIRTARSFTSAGYRLRVSPGLTRTFPRFEVSGHAGGFTTDARRSRGSA